MGVYPPQLEQIPLPFPYLPFPLPSSLPLPIPTFCLPFPYPLFLYLPFSFPSCFPQIQIEGLGERCELFQRDLGQSPGRKLYLVPFK